MDIRMRIVNIGGPREVLGGFPKAAKAGLHAAGDYWHDRMLPHHFEPYAGAKYRYKRRTPKYERRKQRKLGHAIPLVYTGRLKDWVTRMHRITGTSTRVSVVLTTPFYVQTYRTRPTMPDMGTLAAPMDARRAVKTMTSCMVRVSSKL